jgi:predicted HAD superfamily Cof-like phosphohydrolase
MEGVENVFLSAEESKKLKGKTEFIWFMRRSTKEWHLDHVNDIPEIYFKEAVEGESYVYAHMNPKYAFKAILDPVRKFNEAFDIETLEEPKALTQDKIKLNARLMAEENTEYREAGMKKDLVEIADALGDQMYILAGNILKHGLQDKIADIYMEIQRSNMAKLDASGKPIKREDGKVIKPDTWTPPNIKKILED